MMAFTRTSALALAAALLLAAGWAGQASATVAYPDYIGTSVTYTNIQETSNAGDPEPLWGAPIGLGDQLLFFPPSFRADSIDGVSDSVGSHFQARVTSHTALDIITSVNITEFGDAQISGGTSATGTYAAMAGFITVLADTSGPIAPVIVGFTGVFTPSDFLFAPGDAGTTLWSATASIDLSGLNATEIQISLDNDLAAFSELGTSAAIQKKVVNGPAVIIDVVPEPGTALLLGTGLVFLSARQRRGRRA